MSKHIYSYLALGDSYTIGEQVALHESFPYQTIQKLRQKGHLFYAPETIAKTGWTTFELAEHLIHTIQLEKYDFVSLLIGVNNQYRGLSIEEFKKEFEFLLKKAIHFTDNNSNKVFVLSIPDWGVTPFAKDRNETLIAQEIDSFNIAKKEISDLYQVKFIEITTSTRQAKNDTSFLANDLLHYSDKEYGKWATLLANAIEESL